MHQYCWVIDDIAHFFPSVFQEGGARISKHCSLDRCGPNCTKFSENTVLFISAPGLHFVTNTSSFRNVGGLKARGVRNWGHILHFLAYVIIREGVDEIAGWRIEFGLRLNLELVYNWLMAALQFTKI